MFKKLERLWKEKSSRSIISLFDDPKRAMDFSVDLGISFLIILKLKLMTNVVQNF